VITTYNTINGCDLVLHLAQHPDPRYSFENNEDALSTLFLIEYGNLDLVAHPWYQVIIYYLQYERCPNNIEYHEQRTRLEASKYLILNTSLFRRTVDEILLHCVDDTISQKILKEIHGSVDSNIHIGGNFVAKASAHKILRIGYYWPSIFKDPFKFVRHLYKLVMSFKRLLVEKSFLLCLYNIIHNFPFSKWGLDFVGPINPPYFAGHVFILSVTY